MYAKCGRCSKGKDGQASDRQCTKNSFFHDRCFLVVINFVCCSGNDAGASLPRPVPDTNIPPPIALAGGAITGSFPFFHGLLNRVLGSMEFGRGTIPAVLGRALAGRIAPQVPFSALNEPGW